MPSEQEELKLIVTLVDNASAGLDKIVEKTKEMGGPQVKEAHEKMRRGTEELNKAFKEITGGFGDAFKALGSFRGGLVAGAGGLALFGVEMTRQVSELKKWAEELRGISQAAKSIGVDPASMKNIISQFEAVGVSADQTKANLGKMADAVADLNRQGSALRRELLHIAGPTPEAQANMREFLDKVVHARTEEERYNAVAEARNNVLKNALANGYTLQEATNRANAFASHFWDKTMEAKERLNQLSAEERRIQDERIAKAREFANITGDIASEWSDIIEDLKAPMLDPAVKAAKVLLEVTKEIHEWLKKNYELAKPDEAKKSIQDTFGKFRGPLQLGTPTEEQKKATEENTEASKKLKESNDQLIDALKQQGYSPMSYTGGGGGRSPLLQNASFTTGGAQGFSYGGGGGYGPFGGGRGFGGGGVSYGGSGSGSGSYGGSGMGGHGGGGGAPYGSDTGGATGGPQSGPAGDPSVPSDILAKARSVALHGGPRAVEQFMASQGYPKAGNWCGEFAASVVKSVGGTPPKGAAIASNWRNWGTPVAPGDAQPGDIAVADRGVRTGATGSHVTIVEDVSRKAGTFTGLGGNQGRGFESQFALKGYSFRRSTGEMPNGQTAGPGTGAGAGSTPATADGAKGAGGVNEAIRSTHGMAGMDEAHWKAIASIESSLDPNSNANRSTQYKGLFQIGTRGADSEWARRGRGSPYDPHANAEAAAKLAADNNAWFKGKFGRDPTAVETYMMHQQGRGFYLRGTMTNIAGNPYPGMRGPQTPESFEAGWGREIEKRAQRFASDRQQIDQSQAANGKGEGSGKISVDVNAPKGTKVDAQGGGIFKDVEINRQTQMERARSGPETISI
jgi:hypothetical protein